MTTILRSSMYHPDDLPHPITVVCRAQALKVPVEEAAASMEQPGMFVVNDIFETPADVDDPHAVILGVKRLKDSTRLEEECNMAISYYWNAMQLPKIMKGGALANPRAAPLCAEQLKVVLRQLRKHPSYNGQRIIMFSRDGEAVMMDPSGEIKVVKP